MGKKQKKIKPMNRLELVGRIMNVGAEASGKDTQEKQKALDEALKELSDFQKQERQINKVIEIDELIDRLEAMKPLYKMHCFDIEKEKDPVYCIEFGMNRQKKIEKEVYERYIKELKKLNQ